MLYMLISISVGASHWHSWGGFFEYAIRANELSCVYVSCPLCSLLHNFLTNKWFFKRTSNMRNVHGAHLFIQSCLMVVFYEKPCKTQNRFTPMINVVIKNQAGLQLCLLIAIRRQKKWKSGLWCNLVCMPECASCGKKWTSHVYWQTHSLYDFFYLQTVGYKSIVFQFPVGGLPLMHYVIRNLILGVT